MNTDGSINWTYIFITLIIRFVGVAALLGILGLGIFIAGKIIARFATNDQNSGKQK